MTRHRSHPNTKISTTRRFTLRKSLVGISILVAVAGNVFLSRQYLVQLSSSSVAWSSLDEVHVLAEASGLFGRENDTISSNTTNHNSNSELRQGFQEQPGNSTKAVSLREAQLPEPRPQLQNTTIDMWCFLDDKSTYIFHHFPHALQALSQCWSFFQSMEAELKASASPPHQPNQDNFQCRININRVAGFGSVDQDWRAALVVEIMQCTYSYTRFNLSQLPQNSTVVSLTSPADIPQDQKQPKGKKHTKKQPELPRNNATHTYYLFRPHHNDSALYRFFWDPQHGQVLRNRLYETETYRKTNLVHAVTTNHSIVDTKDNETTNSSGSSIALMDETVLRIGLVNRLKNRKVGNMDQLEQAIRRMYPDCIVERATMEGMTPLEQFTWWSRQSIVILPHGAASTNLVFLKPGSAIIELFPPHYYWWGFWALSKTLNVRYYGYFPLMSTTGNTSRSERNKLVVKMYEASKQSCTRRTVDHKNRDLPVHYPSIPHVLVLLRRAVADRQHYQQQQKETIQLNQSDRNLSSWSYVPQISKMASHCELAQHVSPNEDNLVHHFDDDPPQTLLDEYS